jgi:hypothetical protein
LHFISQPIRDIADPVDMNDGTVYDTDTKLSWMQNATWIGATNWSNATDSLVGFSYAGLTGWRLQNADNGEHLKT